MKNANIAPCGVLCDLCLGFQRTRNRCVGCIGFGNKPYHCTVCSIKACPEKHGKEDMLCIDCDKFPCRRIKDLDKRYTTRYGESPVKNLQSIKELGVKEFIKKEKAKWICSNCGHLLCVHRELCLICGSKNQYFPGAN